MPTKKPPLPDPSELKIALENRTFEINLFWQRSNYFLVLITALGAGAFTVRDDWLSFVISLFAWVSSFLWFRTNLGSRFWQGNWEVEVTLLAKEQGIRSFERQPIDIFDQVKGSLGDGHGRWFFRRWVDRQILKKPSVTFHMIILSLVTTMFWLVISIVKGWMIYPKMAQFVRDLLTWMG